MTATFGNSSLWTCETRSSERAAGVPIPRWNFNPGYHLLRERFVDTTSAEVSKRNFRCDELHRQNLVTFETPFRDIRCSFSTWALAAWNSWAAGAHQAVTRLQIVRKRKSCANREQTVSRDVKQRQKVPRKAAAQQTKPR